MAHRSSKIDGISRTLWFWPSGIYPRRVVYYLRAKGLSASDLMNASITLIPCFVNLTSQDLSMESISGLEKRPSGFSLPVLRTRYSSGECYIAESSSILEYLEDIFPASRGFANLRGEDYVQTAKIRDIVQLVNELLTWCNVHVRHSTEFSLLWSGMTKEQQSLMASGDARLQITKLLDRLQLWTEGNITNSLTGAKRPNLADVTVAAAKTSMEEIYGIQIFEGFPKLDAWWNQYSSSEWFVSRSEIDLIETGRLQILTQGDGNQSTEKKPSSRMGSYRYGAPR